MKDKKEKIHKTNALRQLDKNKIPYTIHTYEWSEDKSGGLGVAEHFPELAERIFKTIVLKGKSKSLYVCVIHGEAHLDLKKVAKACGEKNIDLLPLSELEKETGYVRGGCSPVGMKKLYDTFFDVDAQKQWLKAQGKKVVLEDGSEKGIDDCTDEEIKRANTGSQVFLKAVVSLVDAIEDVSLKISV